jgi:hypothetical protein
MSQTISERATATIQPQKPKVQRVCCPLCEGTFNLGAHKKPRSPEQHKRFFALVHACYAHFPEGGHDGFQPDSFEHMRHWLTCKAGPEYRTVDFHQIVDTGNPILNARLMEAVEGILAQDRSPKFARWNGLNLTVFRPKSIAYHAMTHAKFNVLNQAVEDVIQGVFNVTGDELLEQAKGNV